MNRYQIYLFYTYRKQDSNKKCCFYLCQNKAHCRTLILIFGRLVSSIKEAQTYRSQREMVISNSTTPPTYLCIRVQQIVGFRECVRTGAAGARTRRSLGHQLLHLLILRLLVLCAPADFENP